MEEIKIYAITGGIGSGKSTAIEIIKELGYKVVSCDEEIAYLYSLPNVKEELKKMFPTAINGDMLDKKIISKIVFNDKNELAKLNNFLHPLVMNRCFEMVRENNKMNLAFIEVPLLFESNLVDRFDGVFIIKRDINSRIESVVERSKLTREEVKDRIKNQIDYESLDCSNYFVITNDGSKEQLKEQIKEKIMKI